MDTLFKSYLKSNVHKMFTHVVLMLNQHYNIFILNEYTVKTYHEFGFNLTFIIFLFKMITQN